MTNPATTTEAAPDAATAAARARLAWCVRSLLPDRSAPLLLLHADSSGVPGRVGTAPVRLNYGLGTADGAVPEAGAVVINWPAAAQAGDREAASVLSSLGPTRMALIERDHPWPPPSAAALAAGVAPAAAAETIDRLLSEGRRVVTFAVDGFVMPLVADFCVRRGRALSSRALDALEEAVDLAAAVKVALMDDDEAGPLPPSAAPPATWAAWRRGIVQRSRLGGGRRGGLPNCPGNFGYAPPPAGSGLMALAALFRAAVAGPGVGAGPGPGEGAG